MKQKNIVLVVAAAVIIGSIVYLNKGSKQSLGDGSAQDVVRSLPSEDTGTTTSMIDTNISTSTSTSTAVTISDAKARIKDKAARYSVAKELVSPNGFVNTNGKAITLSQYVGKKVILLDIWTYSCINCQRTIPHLNDLYAKYKDKGLVIIGLHLPEFDFEKDHNNVADAVKRFGIQYPVVQDNDGLTGRAYGMHYWPEHYLIDIDGFVVDKHIGEGDYADTETKVQALLNERVKVLGQQGTITSTISSVNTTVVSPTTPGQSPETYFGANRNQFFGNGTQGNVEKKSYTAPALADVLPDTFYLSGLWDIQGEYATSGETGASIYYKYNSNNVFFVAGAESSMKVELLLDGGPLGALAGADVTNDTGADGKSHSYVTISGTRLYRLIKSDTFSTHTLQIMAPNAGLKAFTFTFGADM